ncbi:hypothetical protein [Halobacillus litoralis]|nr:hypothetical protein [Halobacillus litoralis]
MRINLLIFTIRVERMDLLSLDRSIRRKQSIEQKINERKSKYYFV